MIECVISGYVSIRFFTASLIRRIQQNGICAPCSKSKAAVVASIILAVLTITELLSELMLHRVM